MPWVESLVHLGTLAIAVAGMYYNNKAAFVAVNTEMRLIKEQLTKLDTAVSGLTSAVGNLTTDLVVLKELQKVSKAVELGK